MHVHLVDWDRESELIAFSCASIRFFFFSLLISGTDRSHVMKMKAHGNWERVNDATIATLSDCWMSLATTYRAIYLMQSCEVNWTTWTVSSGPLVSVLSLSWLVDRHSFHLPRCFPQLTLINKPFCCVCGGEDSYVSNLFYCSQRHTTWTMATSTRGNSDDLLILLAGSRCLVRALHPRAQSRFHIIFITASGQISPNKINRWD